MYLNKWSGELQLEIKEGCVHGTCMHPLLTNSWIFFYLKTSSYVYSDYFCRNAHFVKLICSCIVCRSVLCVLSEQLDLDFRQTWCHVINVYIISERRSLFSSSSSIFSISPLLLVHLNLPVVMPTLIPIVSI